MTDTLIASRGIDGTADPQATQPAAAKPPVEGSPAPVPGTVTEASEPTRMGRKHRFIRFAILIAVVGGLAAAATVLPLREIADVVVSLGPAAAVAIAVVGGLLLSALVPRTAITIACGALLGAATGAATALAASVIAAIATYYAGRWAGRGVLSARAGGRLERLDGWLNRRGLSAVLLVRLLPLAPFGLIGYAYGTTSVCRKRYLLGTTLASIPSAVTYAIIGSAVTHPGSMNPLTIAPAAIGFILTTIIVIRWRREMRRPAPAA